MKARAGILTLLILMISLAGFGNTTPDLIQNSDAVTISNYDVGGDIVIVLNVEAANADFILLDYKMDNPIFTSQEISTKILSNIPGKLETVLSELDKPPLIHFSKDNKINYIPPLRISHKDVLIYRRARDGINCNFSRVQLT